MVPPEITRMAWWRFFDASEPVHALVAEKDGRRSTSLLGRTCYLQDLFTTEEARGQGVGRALIETMYDQPDRDGPVRQSCRAVRLPGIPQAAVDFAPC
jgi:GNAT superfamily N-acetyltransferase